MQNVGWSLGPSECLQIGATAVVRGEIEDNGDAFQLQLVSVYRMSVEQRIHKLQEKYKIYFPL